MAVARGSLQALLAKKLRVSTSLKTTSASRYRIRLWSLGTLGSPEGPPDLSIRRGRQRSPVHLSLSRPELLERWGSRGRSR